MENREIIDTTVSRHRHVIEKISADECKAWLNSRITKSLINTLDMCGILTALQFEDYEDGNNDAILHVMIPFDIKAAMIERQRNCKNEG